jgi:hypothetical protein
VRLPQGEALRSFWAGQLVEVSEVPPDPAVFKVNSKYMGPWRVLMHGLEA